MLSLLTEIYKSSHNSKGKTYWNRSS